MQLRIINNLRTIHVIRIEENRAGVYLLRRPSVGSAAGIGPGEILVITRDGWVSLQPVLGNSLQIDMLAVALAKIIDIDVRIECTRIVASEIEECAQRR